MGGFGWTAFSTETHRGEAPEAKPYVLVRTPGFSGGSKVPEVCRVGIAGVAWRARVILAAVDSGGFDATSVTQEVHVVSMDVRSRTSGQHGAAVVLDELTQVPATRALTLAVPMISLTHSRLSLNVWKFESNLSERKRTHATSSQKHQSLVVIKSQPSQETQTPEMSRIV